MEAEFSPYGTQSDVMWPSGGAGSFDLEREISDASAITIPIGSRRQTIDAESLRTVDMAGRILNYWRPKNDGIQTLPKIVHEPPEKRDQDSVCSAETEQPFDVIQDRRKKEAEDAAKSPIAKLTEYFDEKTTCLPYQERNFKLTAAHSDSGLETTRRIPKLNLDALPSRGANSVVTSRSDIAGDTTSEFSAFNFAEISSTGIDSPNSMSDAGSPESELQRKLNHRRRLQRIRVLAAFEDDKSEASFHLTGTPTKLRERRDREHKEAKRRKSFGYEDPLMKTAEPLVTLLEDEEDCDKTPGLALAEDEYSLFSFDQTQESPTANQTIGAQESQTHSPEENRLNIPQENQTQSPKAVRSKSKALVPSPSATSFRTVTIDEDRELPGLPANLDRINFEKIVGDETVFSSESRYDDTASMRSDYTKTDASEVKDAIKDVLFLGDEAETRPGRRKKSGKKNIKFNLKRQRNEARNGPHRQVSGKSEEVPKGGMWKDLAFTLGLNDDDDDNDTKLTEETQSAITRSPTSPGRAMERSPQHNTHAPSYSSNPPVPQNKGYRNNQNSTYDINQLQRRQNRAPQPDIFEGFPFPVSSLNSDHDFVLLALFAAQAVHELQGVRFDDSYPLDMYEDLKISVVELKMPLGVILMENAGGCFVTKIAADGSAARSGGVKVGDQLAAINGQKCLRMRVEDIYKIILTISEPIAVQLAFIRYIGPFRPETRFDEEDNSVVDITRPRQTMRVVKDVSTKPTSDRKKIRTWFRKLKGKNA